MLLLDKLNSSPVNAAQIKNLTDQDPVLAQDRNLVLHGLKVLPADREEMKPYFKRQSKLSVQDGCILWGVRVIVPAQKLLLEELHMGHPYPIESRLEFRVVAKYRQGSRGFCGIL